MSNQKNSGTATEVVAPRNREELDGTLLLPVATHVPVMAADGLNMNITTDAPPILATATVVPSTEMMFEYDDAAMAKEDRLQKQDGEGDEDENALLAEGIVLPENNYGATQHNYAGVSDDSRQNVRKANTAAVLKSHEELNAIRQAKQRIVPHQHHDNWTMQHANKNAQRRDREGLQIHNDHIGERKSAPVPPAAPPTTTRNPPSRSNTGYHVHDYDVRAYDTNFYDVKDYNSVYD